MQTNDWLLDSPTPGDVSTASFQLVRRGFDPVEVQAFARSVGAELERLHSDNESLRNKVTRLESRATADLDENLIAEYLGEETTRLLNAARETAAGIVARAEARAKTTTETAQDDARRMRADAKADAASERDRAENDAREMIAEATAHRRDMLAALAARRDEACAQLDELLDGREVLLRELRNLAGTADALVGRLDAISADPADFPNLDPSVESSGEVVDRDAVLRVTLGDPDTRGTRGVVQDVDVDDLDPLDDDAVLVLDS
jgi:cell division septum initiation protein DivIVA